MVRLGELDVKYVDLACSRVLYAKFKAGLFENPYGLPIEEYEKKVRTKEKVALSRRISEESVVMVKNEGNLLPLDMKKLKSVAVIGPNANQVQLVTIPGAVIIRMGLLRCREYRISLVINWLFITL